MLNALCLPELIGRGERQLGLETDVGAHKLWVTIYSLACSCCPSGPDFYNQPHAQHLPKRGESCDAEGATTQLLPNAMHACLPAGPMLDYNSYCIH